MIEYPTELSFTNFSVPRMMIVFGCVFLTAAALVVARRLGSKIWGVIFILTLTCSILNLLVLSIPAIIPSPCPDGFCELPKPYATIVWYSYTLLPFIISGTSVVVFLAVVFHSTFHKGRSLNSSSKE